MFGSYVGALIDFVKESEWKCRSIVIDYNVYYGINHIELVQFVIDVLKAVPPIDCDAKMINCSLRMN